MECRDEFVLQGKIMPGMDSTLSFLFPAFRGLSCLTFLFWVAFSKVNNSYLGTCKLILSARWTALTAGRKAHFVYLF